MRVGTVFPQTEAGTDPAFVRDFAQASDALGYTHLLAFDHVLGASHENREQSVPNAYTEETPFHEPLTLFAYLAGLTERIEFVTGILMLPQRQTALVAKQAAGVAILSGNRLRLGVGVGWNPVEYESLGQDLQTRGKRQAEQVDLLRALWVEPIVDFTGQWHRVDRASIMPRPSESIPIWFGGTSDIAHKRAARLGDGFLMVRHFAHTDPNTGALTDPCDQMIEKADQIRALVVAAGRDPEAFGMEGRGRVNYVDGLNAARVDIAKFGKAGFSHVAINTMNAGLSPADHLDALEVIAREVDLGANQQVGAR
jgi:probable F420-dependent oxidoreductase